MSLTLSFLVDFHDGFLFKVMGHISQHHHMSSNFRLDAGHSFLVSVVFLDTCWAFSGSWFS